MLVIDLERVHSYITASIKNAFGSFQYINY